MLNGFGANERQQGEERYRFWSDTSQSVFVDYLYDTNQTYKNEYPDPFTVSVFDGGDDVRQLALDLGAHCN